MGKYKIFIVIIFLIGILIFRYNNMYTALSLTSAMQDKNYLLNKNQTVTFEINKHLYVPKHLPVYLPEFKENDVQSAYSYAKIFSVTRNFSEDDEYYSFETETGKLTVSKNRNQIIFNNYVANLNTDVSKEDVVKIATEYIQNKFFLFNYTEAKVTEDNDKFRVEFINSLNDIKNYSFTDIVTVDKKGNILSLEYNDISFKKFNTCKLIDLPTACSNLIDQLGNKKRATIHNCELVYIYKNSIIQPAYLFEITDSTQNFSLYINAMTF